MLKKIINIKLILILQLFFSCSIAMANDDDSNSKYRDTIKFGLGAFFITNSETIMRIDSKDVPGGVYVNLDEQLGVKADDVEGRIDGYYRFNAKHRLDYGYYPIKRNGTLPINIDIPTDPPISEGTVVSTTFDTVTYKLGYTYSFYKNDKVELGLSAGLHVTSYKLALQSTGGSSNDSASVTAPLPVVGLILNYNITPDWLVLYNTQVFFLQFKGNKGSLLDSNLAIEYRGFEQIAFGIGVNTVSLDIEFGGENYLGTVNNEVEGITTYMAFYF